MFISLTGKSWMKVQDIITMVQGITTQAQVYF